MEAPSKDSKEEPNESVAVPNPISPKASGDLISPNANSGVIAPDGQSSLDDRLSVEKSLDASLRDIDDPDGESPAQRITRIDETDKVAKAIIASRKKQLSKRVTKLSTGRERREYIMGRMGGNDSFGNLSSSSLPDIPAAGEATRSKDDSDIIAGPRPTLKGLRPNPTFATPLPVNTTPAKAPTSLPSKLVGLSSSLRTTTLEKAAPIEKPGLQSMPDMDSSRRTMEVSESNSQPASKFPPSEQQTETEKAAVPEVVVEKDLPPKPSPVSEVPLLGGAVAPVASTPTENPPLPNHPSAKAPSATTDSSQTLPDKKLPSTEANPVPLESTEVTPGPVAMPAKLEKPAVQDQPSVKGPKTAKPGSEPTLDKSLQPKSEPRVTPCASIATNSPIPESPSSKKEAGTEQVEQPSPKAEQQEGNDGSVPAKSSRVISPIGRPVKKLVVKQEPARQSPVETVSQKRAQEAQRLVAKSHSSPLPKTKEPLSGSIVKEGEPSQQDIAKEKAVASTPATKSKASISASHLSPTQVLPSNNLRPDTFDSPVLSGSSARRSWRPKGEARGRQPSVPTESEEEKQKRSMSLSPTDAVSKKEKVTAKAGTRWGKGLLQKGLASLSQLTGNSPGNTSPLTTKSTPALERAVNRKLMNQAKAPFAAESPKPEKEASSTPSTVDANNTAIGIDSVPINSHESNSQKLKSAAAVSTQDDVTTKQKDVTVEGEASGIPAAPSTSSPNQVGWESPLARRGKIAAKAANWRSIATPFEASATPNEKSGSTDGKTNKANRRSSMPSQGTASPNESPLQPKPSNQKTMNKGSNETPAPGEAMNADAPRAVHANGIDGFGKNAEDIIVPLQGEPLHQSLGNMNEYFQTSQSEGDDGGSLRPDTFDSPSARSGRRSWRPKGVINSVSSTDTADSKLGTGSSHSQRSLQSGSTHSFHSSASSLPHDDAESATTPSSAKRSWRPKGSLSRQSSGDSAFTDGNASYDKSNDTSSEVETQASKDVEESDEVSDLVSERPIQVTRKKGRHSLMARISKFEKGRTIPGALNTSMDGLLSPRHAVKKPPAGDASNLFVTPHRKKRTRIKKMPIPDLNESQDKLELPQSPPTGNAAAPSGAESTPTQEHVISKSVISFQERLVMFSRAQAPPSDLMALAGRHGFLSPKFMKRLVEKDAEPAPAGPTNETPILELPMSDENEAPPAKEDPVISLDKAQALSVKDRIAKLNGFHERRNRLRATKSALLGQKDVNKKDVFKAVLAKAEELTSYQPPVFTKEPDDIKTIKSALMKNFVFEDLKENEIDQFVAAFENIKMKKGEVIYEKGDKGDFMYVVAHGEVQMFVDGKRVGRTSKGNAFGEVSLLYTSARATTARAATQSTSLFRVDQSTFRFMMQSKTRKSEEAKLKLLRDISFLSNLGESDVNRICSVMTPVLFYTGDYIVKKGEEGNSFFILKEGRVRVTDLVVGGTKYEDLTLEPGDYFGEAALISTESRAANVLAMSKGTAFSIDRGAFEKVLGDFADVLSKTQDRQRLEGIKVFKDAELGSADFDTLVTHITDREFAEEEVIFKQKENVEAALYIVREGSVQIDKEDGSRSEEIGAGGYFGQEQLMADSRGLLDASGMIIAGYNAVAKGSKCVLGVLSLKDCRAVVDTTSLGGVEFLGQSSDLLSRRSAISGSIKKSVKEEDLEKVRVLGDGQFGEVWLVKVDPFGEKDESNMMEFALKVQLKEDPFRTENAIEAIKREVTVMKQLTHPFIIHLVETFETEETISMLMEVVKGGELWSVMHREDDDGNWISGLSETHSKFYSLVVADTLAYMHRQKFIFRDLKPENVLMDNEGYPVIVDFGFAKHFLEGEKTYTFCGTPNYLAPEIVMNLGHDIAVDHWALGILTYEMITGENPFYFEDMDQMALFQAVSQEPFFPLPKTSSPELVSFMTGLLEKEPVQRLGSLAGRERDIVHHSWFADLDLQKMRNREVKAPFIPNID